VTSTTTATRAELAAAVAGEQDRAAPPQVAAVCREILRVHGTSVLGLLFYGSCLREHRPDEGVIDVYVLVRSYRGAYRSRALAASNALLPPNVFYVEVPSNGLVVRAKYAVISLEDFARAVRPESFHATIWGRFCQPALLAWAASKAARAEIAALGADAVVTMVLRATALMLARDGSGEIRSEDLWLRGFRETYKTELRAERRSTVAGIYHADPGRYDRMLALAIRCLDAEGSLSAVPTADGAHRVRMGAASRKRLVRGWKIRRPVAKAVSVVRLVKSALTFGDWVPYALWKVQRHTGVRPRLTPLQSRHPLIFGWPVVLRLVRQRALR